MPSIECAVEIEEHVPSDLAEQFGIEMIGAPPAASVDAETLCPQKWRAEFWFSRAPLAFALGTIRKILLVGDLGQPLRQRTTLCGKAPKGYAAHSR